MGSGSKSWYIPDKVGFSAPAAQVEAWLTEQRRAMEEGIFFAACNYYAYIARRAT